MIQKKWIGIDISKEKLDIFVIPNNEYRQISYNKKEVNQLISWFKELGSCLIVLEATGGLEEYLARSLSNNDLEFCVLNPRKVRDFAKAEGILAKTDKIDAKVLAQYAEKMKPVTRPMISDSMNELKKLYHRRCQLQTMIKAEKNRLSRADKEVGIYIERHIAYMVKQMEKIDKKINDKISCDENLKNKVEIMKSIPGVGNSTAFALVSDLNELGVLNKKKICALAGVAPFNKDSGTKKGKRSIWGGRFNVRCALYMATIASIRHNEVINTFYKRLRTSGKAPKVAIVACMRKLLVILNTMIKNGTAWNPEIRVIN
jgi:transposase